MTAELQKQLDHVKTEEERERLLVDAMLTDTISPKEWLSLHGRINTEYTPAITLADECITNGWDEAEVLNLLIEYNYLCWDKGEDCWTLPDEALELLINDDEITALFGSYDTDLGEDEILIHTTHEKYPLFIKIVKDLLSGKGKMLSSDREVTIESLASDLDKSPEMVSSMAIYIASL